MNSLSIYILCHYSDLGPPVSDSSELSPDSPSSSTAAATPVTFTVHSFSECPVALHTVHFALELAHYWLASWFIRRTAYIVSASLILKQLL